MAARDPILFPFFFLNRIFSGSSFCAVVDSPGAPPSATAHELFRGFSYIAPIVSHDALSSARTATDGRSIANVRILSDGICKYRTEFVRFGSCAIMAANAFE